MKKINNFLESREHLISQLKSQLIGPLDGHFTDGIAVSQYSPNDVSRHKQEILPSSPRQTYLAGVLYPQKSKFDTENQEEKDSDKSKDNNEETDLLIDNKKEENIDYNENDDEVTSDNNLDLDLTNELRPSAISFSILASIKQELFLGVKDIGIYRKLKNSNSRRLMIVTFYLSKFAKEKASYIFLYEKFKLENSNRSTIHIFLENFFSNEIEGITAEKIKRDYEDYFDKYFEAREGWKNLEKKVLDEIYYELNELSKENLETRVEEILSNKIEDIEYDGYARKAITQEISLKPEDFKKKKIVKKIIYQNRDTGLEFSINCLDHEFDSDKKYLTISLINTNISSDSKILTDKCFFQTNFYIQAKNNNAIVFFPFEDLDIEKLSEEDQSLYLLHHKRKSYAIGHGCSVSWKIDEKNNIIFSEILPTYEVKPILPTKFEDVDLDMKMFSDDVNFATSQLQKLLKKYSEWLENEEIIGQKLEKEVFKSASKKNIDKAKKVLGRIEEGLDILKKDKVVQKSFCLMNQAMYLQQVHYKISNSDFNKNINYENLLKKNKKGKWYPFQIAFILLNIKSFFEPSSDDRKIMDLIWFPTGGGKTEAYLGVTAFTIFLRKIRQPNSQGCTALMRYTLRLLTTQQFQRASSLICACEKIRSENVDLLGRERVTLGLWIGGESTPNREKRASELLEQLIESPNFTNNNKFVLLNCPWCYSDLTPNDTGVSGYIKLKNKFHYRCINTDCLFCTDENIIPVTVIDERIYKEIPTLIIGTIDKFATLPWSEEAIGIFDNKNNKNVLKPDLIIQDELHLISGPLGSVAGMYEILITAMTEEGNIPAKIIGSTATISRAEKQIRNLYGRAGSIFPPQTNQVEDSFFSYEFAEGDGRKYLGVFCPSATSPQVTLAKIISTMCLAAKELSLLSEDNLELVDPYWTHLIYFNSIRELMSGASLITADVKGNIFGEFNRRGIVEGILGDSYRKSRRQILEPTELTSRVDASSVPIILSKLDIKLGNKEKKFPVDVCLSTNMIQVGIDIPRLGLMTINGQPKTTSEYIQASSRVGRSVPGLVLTMLSPFRPRDRSHYEKFYSYHQNLYKYVEPTSITSNSDPVRERCLHAVVIGLARLWNDNSRKNPTFPSDETIDKIKKYISNYVKTSDPDHPEEANKTEQEINYIFERWKNLSPESYGSMSTLNATKRSVLMMPSGSENLAEGADPFETPTSMRNVDQECNARIIKSYDNII